MTNSSQAATVDALRDLTEADTKTLDRLRKKLVFAADREGLLDIAYVIVDSPIGPLLLASTDKGLIRIAFDSEDHDQVLETLAAKLSPRILRSPKRLSEAAHELDQYFAGTRKDFDLQLDLSLSSGFRQLVQRYLPEIAYGHTQSYAQVAQQVGNPKAVRAVGSACATNPIPIVIPCHRALRSDGSLGGYAGGLPAKTTLLALEAAAS